jgi:hypothetical protein
VPLRTRCAYQLKDVSMVFARLPMALTLPLKTRLGTPDRQLGSKRYT